MDNSSTSNFSQTRAKSESLEPLPRHVLSDDNRDPDPDWSTYAAHMRAYDEAMVRGWKEEIDTLLVFAGLFSAVVTAFNIEAYHLLQDDPTQVSIQILLQISQQLAMQTTGSNATSETPLVRLGSSSSFRPSAQSIRINALWFSSLVFSLLSALIGILVKQWTREYMTAMSLSPRDTVRLRQHRFDSFVAWHVPEIMALLPLLLQISLILFFIGLIDFLFLLQSTVAAIVTVLMAVALLFYAAATLVPVFNVRCPYKSPQSWILVRIKRRLTHWVYVVRERMSISNIKYRDTRSIAPAHSSWSECDHAVLEGDRDELDLKALVWIHSSFTDNATLDSLIPFVPELTPDNAAILAYTDLARHVHMPTGPLIALVHARSCSQLLRDVGATLPKHARARSVRMLLGLLECIPRDHDPARLGALDVLWTLWELCVGACDAEHQSPGLYQLVLNGVAKLLSEGEPFRLRRAAINFLWESTYQWTDLYCPAAVRNVIAFACASREDRLPDTFLKACAVALLLAPPLGWLDASVLPSREQLQLLLCDLAHALQRGNELGTRYEARCVGRIAHGLAHVVQKGLGIVVEPELPAALLESVELGLAGLTAEEELEARRTLLWVRTGHGHQVNGLNGALHRHGSDGSMSGKAG